MRTLVDPGAAVVAVERASLRRLTGKDKKETVEQYGAEQVHVWRRSYDTPPPPIEPGSEFDVSSDPRYAHLPPEDLPRAECLKDVLERALPYWVDGIVADLLAGACTLVAAHGNSLRAPWSTSTGSATTTSPTSTSPPATRSSTSSTPACAPITGRRYLDPEAAAAGEAAVKAQTGGSPPAYGRAPTAAGSGRRTVQLRSAAPAAGVLPASAGTVSASGAGMARRNR